MVRIDSLVDEADRFLDPLCKDGSLARWTSSQFCGRNLGSWAEEGSNQRVFTAIPFLELFISIADILAVPVQTALLASVRTTISSPIFTSG